MTAGALHPWNTSFEWRRLGIEPRRLTSDQVESFHRTGWLVVEDLFEQAMVTDLTADLDTIEEEAAAFVRAQPDSRLVISESGAITFAPHLVPRSAAARRLSESPPITDLCHDLLGLDVRLYWDQLVYKHPDKPREFPWHQDNGYAYVDPQQYLTIWLALTDATIDNGCPWGRTGSAHPRHPRTPLRPPARAVLLRRPPGRDRGPRSCRRCCRLLIADTAPHRAEHHRLDAQDLHPPVRTGRSRGAARRSGGRTTDGSSDAGRSSSTVRGAAQRSTHRSRRVRLPDWTDRVSWLTWPVVLVIIQQVWFPAPAGSLLAGFILGLITSLISLGMYLVYRANRVLNFTAGELGLLPAVLSVMLIIESGLSWYLGFGIGFAAAAVLGVAVEFLIIRRFFDAPRLVVTVATIGVAQLLGVGALFLPGWWGRPGPVAAHRYAVRHRFSRSGRACSTPTTSSRSSSLPLRWWRSACCCARPASASRSEPLPNSRAAPRCSASPVKGLQSVVWSVATILGFIALFLRSGIYGLPVGGALGLLLLLRSLAALTLGRLIHLPTIIAASLALGVLQEAVVWNSGSIEAEAKMGAITGVVIVAGLLFRRTRGMRSEIDTSSWQNAGDVRPIAEVYRALPLVRIGRIVGITVIALAFLAFRRRSSARLWSSAWH